MNRHTIATATTTAGLLAAALLLTGCSSEPDIAACKTAMKEQLNDAIEKDTEGSRPAACEGVDPKTLERLAGELIEGEVATAVPDKVSSIGDCVALLERNYQAGTSRDVSNEPECSGLTEDEYTTAVAGVLAGHKDDILADAEQQYVWDEAWSQTDPAQQDLMCDRLHADGPVVVGNEMKGDNPTGDEIDMARYILAEKC